MLKDKIQDAEKSEHASKGSGDWYKFQEGDNKLRILTEPEMIYEDYTNGICFTDCGFQGASKGMSYVLDLKDNKIKLMKMPWKMVKQLGVWEVDDEYGYTAYPMPYAIKVNAVNAGTKEVEYTFTAGRSNSDVGDDVLGELMNKKPVAEIIEALKEKNKKKHGSMPKPQAVELPTVEYPTADAEGINPEDIPF